MGGVRGRGAAWVHATEADSLSDGDDRGSHFVDRGAAVHGDREGLGGLGEVDGSACRNGETSTTRGYNLDGTGEAVGVSTVPHRAAGVLGAAVLAGAVELVRNGVLREEGEACQWRERSLAKAQGWGRWGGRKRRKPFSRERSELTVVEGGVRCRGFDERGRVEAALIAVPRHVVVPPLDVNPIL